MHIKNTINQLGHRLANACPSGTSSLPEIEETIEDRNYENVWTTVSLFTTDPNTFKKIVEMLLSQVEQFRDSRVSHAISVHSEGRILSAWTWAPGEPN